MYEYHKKVNALLDQLVASEQDKIDQVAQWMADTILSDRLIHTFGTGHSHMIGYEMFTRAGGLSNVNAMMDSLALSHEGAYRSADLEQIPGLARIIWNQYTIHSDDIMIIISNSGRNAVPIEMAQIAKDHHIRVVAITSLRQSTQYPSRHSSGKKLLDIADIVIDNQAPSGDGMIHLDGHHVGAASSIAGIFLVNILSTEAMKIAVANGHQLEIYQSQNIDGISNDPIYEKYKNRIKHL